MWLRPASQKGHSWSLGQSLHRSCLAIVLPPTSGPASSLLTPSLVTTLPTQQGSNCWHTSVSLCLCHGAPPSPPLPALLVLKDFHLHIDWFVLILHSNKGGPDCPSVSGRLSLACKVLWKAKYKQ